MTKLQAWRSLLLSVLVMALWWPCGSDAQEDRWISRGHIGESIWGLDVNPKDPLTLYAGLWMFMGVFKSCDGGITWRDANAGLGDSGRDFLAVDPLDTNVVYAGGSSRDVYRTTNGGISWSKYSEFPTDWVSDLEIDPQNASVMYAAGGSWFFTSTDGGLSWESVRTSLDMIVDIALDPEDPQRVYAADTEGVWRTTDGGWAWDKACDEGFWAIAIHPQHTQLWYASYGGYGGGIYKSQDGGHTWEEMTQTGLGGLGADVIVVAPLDSSTHRVYIGTDDGVFSIEQSVTTGVDAESWGRVKTMFW